MVRRGFQSGLIFLISFILIFIFSTSLSYSRPPAKKVKAKSIETTDKEDESKDQLEHFVPATNIIPAPKPIPVKPVSYARSMGASTKPAIPRPSKIEKPTMPAEPIRVTTLTKPEPTDLAQGTTESAGKQEE